MADSNNWASDRDQRHRRHCGLHCATWNSCCLLGCHIFILEFVARANKIQAKYVYSVRSSSQVCISQSRLIQVEDQKVQCLVPNFQYRRPPKMQISMTMMSMRTILLVNTLRYIFLSILLLLPSSTSVSTSLGIQDITAWITQRQAVNLFLVLSRVSL